MNENRDDRPDRQEEPEYHIVRPEEERSAYSDAYYRTAPREGKTPYGYNPSRYYAWEDDDCHRGQVGIRAILALSLVCVIVAGILGVGGLYLLARDRRQDRAATRAEPGTERFYAEARQAGESSGPLSLSPIPDGTAPMSGEDIYAMACGQVVGVAAGGSPSGSGFILTSDGYIITNYHVIESGYTRGWPITVVTFDGSSYEASVTGTESDNDLAVLKIDVQGLEPAALGDSDAVTVGEQVWAVGNPMGELPYTMTTGIVSARDRQITTEENVTASMFQFDAAVNSGNSGGPVYNAYGQVIGVVTAKYADRGVEGLGFAIPVSDACFIANELIEKGYVSGKAYLGLVLDNTYTPSVARYYRQEPGAYVRSVQPGSAAEAAGLRARDIITAVDGTAIRDADGLVAAVRGYKAGDEAELTVRRGGEWVSVSVTFGEAVPASPAP